MHNTYMFSVRLTLFKVTEQEMTCYTQIPNWIFNNQKGHWAHTKIAVDLTIIFGTNARINKVFVLS
jgi:hypothetical protein